MITRYALLDDEEPEVIQTSEPVQSAPQSEGDRARAWLSSINLDALTNGQSFEEKFFNYEVSVGRGERVLYLFTKSPQQRIYRRTFPTVAARGCAADIWDGLEHFIAQREAKESQRLEKKQAKRDARAAFVNPYRVGQVLHSSWGYDQTNVEFFQILEVRPLALKVRQISGTHERNHLDGGSTAPVLDRFCKEPAVWVTIQVSERGYHSVPSPIYGDLYTYDGRPLSWSDGH